MATFNVTSRSSPAVTLTDFGGITLAACTPRNCAMAALAKSTTAARSAIALE
jgi:hypothetical protein